MLSSTSMTVPLTSLLFRQRRMTLASSSFVFHFNHIFVSRKSKAAFTSAIALSSRPWGSSRLVKGVSVRT